jgi:NAD-dependent dihydropyrimidine dehydrogenase PreA subunit
MAYVIGLSCVDLKDKTCITECPVDCIYQGGRMMYINPEECIDCGACESVCPVEAISYDADITPEDELVAVAARELFAELGPLGGASGRAPIADPPLVAALPPRSISEPSAE